MGSRLHAIHSAAQLDDVEIDLENALLGPERLDQHSQPRLQGLAHEAVAVPQEEILGDLLGDGAGAPQLLAALAGPDRLTYGVEVEAGVKRKLLVFRGDDGDCGM